LHVNDRKVSGSAYKLKLGKSDGSGRRALHHGTMLLDLKLDALQKYLNPNKKKLESKGVDSVVSRVLNLKEIAPDITHENFCEALERAFIEKWQQNKEGVKKTKLKISEMKKIPKLMEIYEGYSEWGWRFGETPDFKH
jgi:lipoate-protein ligase A